MRADQQYYDKHLETMPRAALEQLQEERLLRMIPYVYERSALVSTVWKEAGIKPSDIRSLADFKEKVPFTDKATLQRFRDQFNDPACGLTCVGAPHLRGIGFTSGTTGDPTAMPRGEVYLPDQILRRDFWQMGARPGDFITLMHFTFRKGQHGDRFSSAGFSPICLAHTPAELPRFIEASLKYRPTVMHQLSTPLVLALEKMFQSGQYDARDVFSSYRGAVFGGEPLSPRLRALLDSWGIEIFEYTTVGDVQPAMECRTHTGVHAWEDSALVEFIDPQTAEPMPNGSRGELVVTALADDIAPLVRYRSEDLVEFDRSPCACGRTHVRFKPIGRTGDEIFVEGRSVLPRDIMALIEQLPETRSALFQIIRTRRESDHLKVRVGYDPELLTTTQVDLCGRLEALLRGHFNVPVVIELQENAELLKLGPPHKIPRVAKQ